MGRRGLDHDWGIEGCSEGRPTRFALHVCISQTFFVDVPLWSTNEGGGSTPGKDVSSGLRGGGGGGRKRQSGLRGGQGVVQVVRREDDD